MKKPYYEVSKKSNIANDLMAFALQPSDWIPYYNFNVKPIPPKIIFQDEFFVWLSHRYSFAAGILKLDPYICYDWHTDTRRGAGVNMLLTPFDRSFCVFTDKKENVVFNIEELKYKPETYYLFNTQIPHTVYNFETTRYLMSVEFIKNKDQLSFDNLLADIRSKNN